MITEKIFEYGDLVNAKIVDRLNEDKEFREDVAEIMQNICDNIAESINSYIENPNNQYEVKFTRFHLYIKNNKEVEWKELGNVLMDYHQRLLDIYNESKK